MKRESSSVWYLGMSIEVASLGTKSSHTLEKQTHLKAGYLEQKFR